MAIHAVIFDLDDTLVATAALWKRAESTLLESFGQTWDENVAMKHKGMNSLDVADVLHDHYSPKVTREEARKFMRSSLIRQFETSELLPMPGAVECIRRAAAKYELAVASGSPPEAIGMALDRLGVLGLFSKVVSSEAAARGKPSPDVYLATAKAMGIPASECIAVEDSLIGAMAARDAGMGCFLIPSNPAARGANWKGVRILESLRPLFVGEANHLGFVD